MLQLLIPLQLLFIPAFILLLIWSSYRTIFKRDRAVGLVLYLGLVIIVDGFYNTGIYIPGFEYGSVRYSEVCAFFLILNNPASRQSDKVTRLIGRILFIYFLLFFYSAFRGITLENGLINFRNIIIPQIIALTVAYKGFEKREDYQRFLFYIMILLIMIGLFTFWDHFFDRWILHSDSVENRSYWASRRQGRFGSFFLNPNYMGAFAVLVFPAVLIRALLEKNMWKKIYCWTGVLALAFAFVKTQSRGPLLGFLVAIFFFVIIPTKNYSIARKLIYLLIFVMVFALFMPGFFTAATGRFSTIESEMDEDSAHSRQTIWSYTVRIIADYPLFGIGLGESKYLKLMFNIGFRDETMSRPLDNAHNSYLQIAVHAGIPACLLFILCNIIAIKNGIALIRRMPDEKLSLYLTGFIAGIIGYLSCLIPDMFMFTATVAPVYWVIFGLIVSFLNQKSKLIEA